VASRQTQIRHGRAVRAQLVRHQHIRREAPFLELAHQLLGRGLIEPSLHQEIENVAFIVDRAPEPELPARNRHGHLADVPSRRWPRASTELSGEQRPTSKPIAAPSHRRHIQTALRQQIFDVATADRETHIEPDNVRVERRRKLMAPKRDRHPPYYRANRDALPVAVTRPLRRMNRPFQGDRTELKLALVTRMAPISTLADTGSPFEAARAVLTPS
jgi:hypothetical protein